MKRLMLVSALGLIALAQAATRPVVLTWGASTTPGVTGYNVYRAGSVAGPFVKITAVPVVGLSYTDMGATIGQGAFYTATSVLTCTNPPQSPCGESPQSSPPVGIASVPAQTAPPGALILIIQ